MVKLRLQRYGRKKRPYYHLVAADARARRDGRIIEDLGRYNPVAQPAVAFMNAARVIYWLQTGAQPTDTVRNILKKEGIFFRMHLIGWGKTEEEIEQTIDSWKADRDANKTVEQTRAEVRKAALKSEEGTVKKAEAAAAEARVKAEAAAAKKAAEVVHADETPATEDVVAEEAAADMVDDGAPVDAGSTTEEVVAEEAAAGMVDEGAPVDAGSTTEEVVAEEAAAATEVVATEVATDEVVDAETAPADEALPASDEEAK